VKAAFIAAFVSASVVPLCLASWSITEVIYSRWKVLWSAYCYQEGGVWCVETAELSENAKNFPTLVGFLLIFVLIGKFIVGPLLMKWMDDPQD